MYISFSQGRVLHEAVFRGKGPRTGFGCPGVEVFQVDCTGEEVEEDTGGE